MFQSFFYVNYLLIVCDKGSNIFGVKMIFNSFLHEDDSEC